MIKRFAAQGFFTRSNLLKLVLFYRFPKFMTLASMFHTFRR